MSNPGTEGKNLTSHDFYTDHGCLQASLRDQIYVSFDLLSGLPVTVANSVAEQIVAGVSLIVQKHQDVIRFAGLYWLYIPTDISAKVTDGVESGFCPSAIDCLAS
jgi:hypothetical protein